MPTVDLQALSVDVQNPIRLALLALFCIVYVLAYRKAGRKGALSAGAFFVGVAGFVFAEPLVQGPVLAPFALLVLFGAWGFGRSLQSAHRREHLQAVTGQPVEEE